MVWTSISFSPAASLAPLFPLCSGTEIETNGGSACSFTTRVGEHHNPFPRKVMSGFGYFALGRTLVVMLAPPSGLRARAPARRPFFNRESYT